MVGFGVIPDVVEAYLESLVWTPAVRRRHSRDRLRCGGDLKDAEREIIAPLCRLRPGPAGRASG